MNGGFTGDVNLNVNTKFDLKDQGENVKYGRNPTREFRTVCLSRDLIYPTSGPGHSMLLPQPHSAPNIKRALPGSPQ